LTRGKDTGLEVCNVDHGIRCCSAPGRPPQTCPAVRSAAR
jgi:hypothetical protein